MSNEIKNMFGNKICIAQIISSFGIDGGAYLKSHLSCPEDILKFKPIYDEYGQGPYEITMIGKPANQVIKIKIKGINSIDKIEELLGNKLIIDRADLEKYTEDNEYLEESLIGCRVINVENTDIGIIIYIDMSTDQHLLEIKDTDGKIRLLPFVDAFIEDIDLESKIIRVTPPQGWEDL